MTYTPEEWDALNVPMAERIIPSYRLEDKSGPQTPTDGPIACAGLAAELQPRQYHRDGSIPRDELLRLTRALRRRLKVGAPIYAADEVAREAAAKEGT